MCPLLALESKGTSFDDDSRCSGRSSRSSLSGFNCKESLVKLLLALFAKEKKEERSRIAEGTRKAVARANQETERTQKEAEVRQRKANEQERALDVELAIFEVRARDEVLSNRSDRARPLRRSISPSSVPINGALRKAEKKENRTLKKLWL